MARLLYIFNEDYQKYYWLAGALWSLCVIQLALYNVANNKIKFLLTLCLLLAVIAVCASTIVVSKYTALCLFIPLFLVGLVFYKIRYNSILPVALPLLWIALFITMFFISPFTKFMLLAMPVSYICISYFSWVLIVGFKDLAFGTSK
jgi:hypothetical protein